MTGAVRPPIAHTTDLSGRDEAAFVHACALAAASGLRLVSLHGNGAPGDVERLPVAERLLSRWNHARARAGRAALAVEHERRCAEGSEDVTESLLEILDALGPGLVVTGAQARHGLSAVLHASVSEALARNLSVPTLVVPNQGRSFVNADTGAVELSRVLVPASDLTSAAIGLAAARTLAERAGAGDVEYLMLHVGERALEGGATERGVRWLHQRGPLEATILETARAQGACLIAMPSAGHDGLRDVLLGSHTEHVIREAGCPVLVVPTRPRGEG
ncbi:MAG: universal stress protein [Kofleriaceae bacterium]